MSRLTRRELIQTGLGALAVGAVGAANPPSDSAHDFSFHFDHVLGTSLDAWVRTTDPSAAASAERLVLGEIERLRQVFSPFDPASEVSRLNQARGAFAASDDLLAVLREYESWHRLSGGACGAQLGGLMRVWSEAQRAGELPSPAALEPIVSDLRSPGWIISGRTVRRLTDQPFDLCSVAKGYVIGQAVEVVRRNVPGVAGLLVNLGGDLGGWGDWHVGVQDPMRPEDNARPLTALRLCDKAVATSGGYQRFYSIEQKRYSHLLDPRTGQPADGIAGATVVAPASVTANALATMLCVLRPDEGIRLVERLPGVECLLVTPAGKLIRSRGFAALELAFAQDEKKEDKTKKDWPDEHQVTIALEVPNVSAAKKYRRPYVAVWIEDGDGKAVRTVAVWGNSSKWLPTMSGWWKIGKDDSALIKAVTRATRAPGKYSVVWDGKDDKGKALPQGTYTVRVEVHREHGKHLFQSGKIACLTDEAKLTLEKNAESGDVLITYGKRK